MARFIDAAYLRTRHQSARVQRFAEQAGGGTAGAAAALEVAIDAAESLAVSYLSVRYRDADTGADLLPTTVETTPAVLQQAVADVALRELVASFAIVDQTIELGYDRAVRWFQAVAAGRADIGITTTPTVDRAAPTLLATATEEDMVFGNGGLDQW